VISRKNTTKRKRAVILASGRLVRSTKAGSDRLESSLAVTGLDADDRKASKGSRKVPSGLPNRSENDQSPSDSFRKFRWKAYNYQSLTAEFAD
jgi:hypothetical protein